jgi:hypothetical protein
MALALAASVSTTTFAFADGIGVTNSGQVGIPQNAASALTPGVTNSSWANTTCSGTACGGNSSGSLGYNFAYTTVASAKAGAEGDSGPSPSGIVGMDAATTVDGLSTAGTSLLALEADNYSRAAMDFTMNGLTNGVSYTLTFDFAEDQQSTATCGGQCNGSYEAQLNVTELVGGAISGSGVAVNIGGAAQGTQTFAGWTAESITFTASGTSEELAFLAGSDIVPAQQVPAFALIDGFTVAPTPPGVPEPNSLLLLSTGLLGLGGFLRMRIKSGSATKA